MAALWALGKRVLGVYAAAADNRVACAGLTIQPASELKVGDTLWVVATCTSPGDVTALSRAVSAARIVHAVEPASVRPSSPRSRPRPPSQDWPTRARAAPRAPGAAEAAYRALLRDPGFGDAVTARYELALVHEQLGKMREAEAGLRGCSATGPRGAPPSLYNLGSFYERQGRWALAARAFARALAMTAPDDAGRRAGCHFHLGEIALAQQDDAAGRDHFAPRPRGDAGPRQGPRAPRRPGAGVRTLIAATPPPTAPTGSTTSSTCRNNSTSPLPSS